MLSQLLKNMPDVVKNLLIINVIMFLATMLFQNREIYLMMELGLYYFDSPNFEPYQIVTSMFMHGGFSHLFFNMFALVMFGSQLEKLWGPKRFLIFYLVTGIGASIIHQSVQAYEVYRIAETIAATSSDVAFSALDVEKLRAVYSIPVLGASGAIFGLLLAFGMLFPNTELMLIFLPIPIKAKYFIPLLMVGELFMGVKGFEWDNIAHFAHLGGALFGFILITIWKRNRNHFY